MRKFRISIAQTFLETARSVQNVGLLIDRAKKKQLSEMTEDDAAATLALAVSSISIIYSVLAVESFVNYQLYSLWKGFVRPLVNQRALVRRAARQIHCWGNSIRNMA